MISLSDELNIAQPAIARFMAKPSHIPWNSIRARSNMSVIWLKTTLRHLNRWQWLLQQYANKEVDSAVAACVFLAWQRMTDYPERSSSITNQVTEWAKKKLPKSVKFIYALLRRYQRQMEKEQRRFLGVGTLCHQCNEPLLSYLQEQYPEHWRSITQAWKSDPALTIRLKKHVLKDEYIVNCHKQGVTMCAHPHLMHTLVSSQRVFIPSLPGYESGDFWVQDAGAICLGELWPVKKGSLLDVGSAPGGKLMLACDAGFICEAIDISQQRIVRLQENVARCGWTVSCMQGDIIEQGYQNKFDVVMCDVPCSGSGVYAKHPESKWLFDRQQIQDNQKKQIRILQSALKAAKPGGYVLYCTCSIFVQENDQVVAQCLQGHVCKPLSHPMLSSTEHGVQCLPTAEQGGFYYACIQKSK